MQSSKEILNIALGYRTRSEFKDAYRRAKTFGLRPNWRPLHLGVLSVVYVNDDQGFSVELLHVPKWADWLMGFKPRRF